MGGCRCSYRTCKSATKLSGDLHFFHYPVKHKERCMQWIRNARKLEFLNLPDDQLRNKVICDLHFETRFFTNVQRKRLVHDAVPTLNTGCDDEIFNENSNEYKDVQILPANADGTIFTVDTIGMQHQSDSEPICTYSFRNGMLVPVYTTEDSNESEQIMYTIDEEDFKNITNFRGGTENDEENYLYIDPLSQEQKEEQYEVILNGNSSYTQDTSEQEKNEILPSDNIDLPEKQNSSDEQMEVVYITENTEESQDSKSTIKFELDSKPQTKRKEAELKVKEEHKNVKKKVLRQIKLHSKEIASIKRTLNAGFNKSKRFNVNALKGRIPSTLLGALTLNLNKRKSNFTDEEIEFLTTLYKASPEAYTKLIEKLNWVLPDPSTVENLLKEPHNA